MATKPYRLFLTILIGACALSFIAVVVNAYLTVDRLNSFERRIEFEIGNCNYLHNERHAVSEAAECEQSLMGLIASQEEVTENFDRFMRGHYPYAHLTMGFTGLWLLTLILLTAAVLLLGPKNKLTRAAVPVTIVAFLLPIVVAALLSNMMGWLEREAPDDDYLRVALTESKVCGLVPWSGQACSYNVPGLSIRVDIWPGEDEKYPSFYVSKARNDYFVSSVFPRCIFVSRYFRGGEQSTAYIRQDGGPVLSNEEGKEYCNPESKS